MKDDIISLSMGMLSKYSLCDSCLGRQFAELLTDMTNRERGKALRLVIAMMYESGRFKIKKDNIASFHFRKRRISEKNERCDICSGIFDRIDSLASRAYKKLKEYKFKTFLVGVKLSDDIAMKEEQLWMQFGNRYAEPIKAELSREIGKTFQEMTKKTYDEKMPDVTIVFDLNNDRIDIDVRSIFVRTGYKKLVRGIPQTKWDKYDKTVEDIIAEPFMKVLKGAGHSLHAAGREDIDAKCLAYRPFVLEIKAPKKRNVDLKKMRELINKSGMVEVSEMKFVSRDEVAKVKGMNMDKIYRAVVSFENDVEDIDRIKDIIGTIEQRTPKRVLHRRADIKRYKKIKSIKWKRINNRRYEIIIRAEAGAYIKELVSGDDGRTKPSIAGLLKNPARVDELDVIGFVGDKNGKKE